MKPLAIAGVNLRRVLRDRTGLFFIVVFPFLIIMAIGAAFGGGFTPTVGVVAADRGLSGDLVARLESIDALEVRRYDDEAALVLAVERGQAEAGVVVPADYDRLARSAGSAGVGFIARPTGVGQQLRVTLTGALDEQVAVLRAARAAADIGGEDFDDAFQRASSLAGQGPQVVVDVTAGEDSSSPLGRFDFGAAQQLILFVFVASLSASATLVESRRLGVSRRMLASPTSVRSVLLGEGLGRFGIAMFQALLIVGVSALLLGVRWGDPLAASVLVVLFCLVGTGAGMLLGAILSNADQAGSMGAFLGLGLAALGGSMVPLEVFPDTMRTIAHMTPHAWAMDGFSELLARGGGLADIRLELLVLASYAVVLLAAATAGLRRSITR